MGNSETPARYKATAAAWSAPQISKKQKELDIYGTNDPNDHELGQERICQALR